MLMHTSVNPVDKQAVRRHFGRRAREYDGYAEVQRAMADALLEHLAAVEEDTLAVRTVLDVGCGTGYLTRKLLDRYPRACCTAVDLAEEMLAVAQERLATSRVRWVCADIEQWVPEGPVDRVVSNATFQWLTEPARTLRTLADALTPDGHLAFATFGPRTFWELDQAFAAAGDVGMPRRGPVFFAAGDWAAMVRDAGLDVRLIREAQWQKRYPTVRAFLDTVKRTGANHAPEGLPRASRRILLGMLEAYERLFGGPDGVPATYHVVWIVARRAP